VTPDSATPRRGRPPSGGREAVLEATLALLRERGASRLTTREVAERAGVSEGSVFYHFGDRTGLLTAVIEDGLRALQPRPAEGSQLPNLHDQLDGFTAGLERFLERGWPAIVAAQSDVALREGLADFLVDNNLGPHRGVDGLGEFLARGQASGSVRPDVDPRAAALLVLGASFLRAAMGQMVGPGYAVRLPDRDAVVDAVVTLLSPSS
jgi:AcrR family transcriptional regulator